MNKNCNISNQDTVSTSVDRTLSTTKTYLSHRQCHELTIELSKKVQVANKCFNRLIALPRGGLVITGWLSYLLNIKRIRILDSDFSPDTITKTDLIVDDLIDTGYSLRPFANRDPSIAVLFTKPWATVNPTFSVGNTTKWLVFPWENEEPADMETDICARQMT